MNSYVSDTLKLLAAGVVVVIVLWVVSKPEVSEKIYDLVASKPVVSEIEQAPADPEAEQVALRLQFARLAATVPAKDKARLDLFVALAWQCVGHMEGKAFDLSRALQQPYGYDAADVDAAKSRSIHAQFPKNITVYFTQVLDNERVRPTSCWVRADKVHGAPQLAVLHAGAVPVIDALIARGWDIRAQDYRSDGNSETSAFNHSKDPLCSRIGTLRSRISAATSSGDTSFTILENGPGCGLLPTMSGI